MTDAWFFSYKSRIYEPNRTKFQTQVGTTAAHKPFKFQEYWLRKSPLLDKKVTKLNDFVGFQTGNPQIWADWNQIWQGIVDLFEDPLCPAKFDPNQCSGLPLWDEKPKKSF